MTGSLSLRLSHLPVTAVEFITDTVVLVGSGASLITYDTQTRSKVAEIAALSNARIHGIICLKDKQLLGNGYRVIAFGSKGWSIVRVCIYSDDKLSMELEQQYLTRDWIKAAHWVYDSNVDCWMVALALAHNRVIICDPNSGAVVSCAQCEEHCILYAAAFFGKTLETLVVASGTVFNQVLIWNPNLQAGDIDQCVDSPIASRLCAHDGVVFGVQFSREGDLVASVSDDRTLRVWNIKEAPCDNQPIATLFGHQARVWKCLVLSKYLVSASEDGTCRVWCRNGNAVGEAVDSWKQCRKNVWSLAANASETLVVSGAADGSICVWAVDVVSGKRVSSNEDLIASEIPTQAEYLPEGVAPRAAEHIRSFALGPSSNPDTFAIMDSGCVLRKRGTLLSDSKAWVLMFYMPELAGYSMVCSTLDGSLTAVGLRDGSVLLLAMSPNNDSVIRHIKRIHGTSVSQLAFSAESESAYDLITMGTDRRVIWSRIRVSGQISWDVLAELRLPGRTRMATAAVSSVAGWMAIGSQNGGLYVYDLPLYLRRLASTTHTAAHEELPAEVPVLELSAHWGKIHGECETTSVVFKTWSPSFAACTADLELDECVPSRCAILTSARDGVMHEFLLSVRRSSASMEVGSEEHVRVAPMANSAVKSADSAYLACIERKTSERLTSGSICRLLRMQNRLYAVTYCRNRIVIIDVLSAVELFSFSFAETDRRWRIQYSGGRMMFVSFMNKLEVLQRHVSLYDETAYYRLADGISSLDIRGADCICVADTAFGGMLVAIGGEDSVLRVLAYDEKRSESKLRPVVQAKRHTSMIRCIRFVPQFNTRSHTQDSRFRYLLTAGASCELRCWRMDIDDEITVLEWAVAPVFASDTESRIMDLAIVDQFTVLQTGHEVVLLATVASDASIRLWQLNLTLHTFTCIAHDAHHVHEHCILSLATFTMGYDANGDMQNFLVTGATDGRLVFWDITRHVADYRKLSAELLPETPVDTGPPAAIIDNVHQSGVNSVDVQVIEDSKIMVASGGDDNSLAICELGRGITTSELTIRDPIRRLSNAHASSIQQVVFTGFNTVCSVATDQRITRWTITRNDSNDCASTSDSNGIEMKDMAFTQVADPSAMIILPKPPHSENTSVLVVGIGVEMFDL